VRGAAAGCIEKRKVTIMRISVAAAWALAAVLALPAGANAASTTKHSHATKHATKHAKAVRPQARLSGYARAPMPFSPYIHRPEYDVYVDGEYAGSDPDPRVRESIKREYIQQERESNWHSW
jgi:hypothetical protein